jgi:hypothetical protein
MRKINVLLVEDIEVSRDLMKLSVNNFNTKPGNPTIVVVGETNSVDTAVKIIQELDKSDMQVELVLLGYEFFGYRRGLKINESYPELAYIVITFDSKVIEEVEAIKPSLRYMVHVNDDKGILMEKVMLEINKYSELK